MFFSILALALAFVHLLSCSKDRLDIPNNPALQPLFSQTDTSNVNLALNYDVVIKRKTTFHNGITAGSPAWKKLEVIPETESYSLQVNLNDGNLYILQDNITVHSHLEDRMLPEDKIAKMEVLNGVCTTYNPQGGVISSQSMGGEMEHLLLDGAAGQYLNNAPVDTALLTANGTVFLVSGNNVLIISRISNGDEINASIYPDMNSGRVLMETVYEDDDPAKIVLTATHEYDGAGNLESSRYTRFDRLSDGDVRRTEEHWDYSNFSITFF